MPGHGGDYALGFDGLSGAQIHTPAGALRNHQLLHAAPGLHPSAARFNEGRGRGSVAFAQAHARDAEPRVRGRRKQRQPQHPLKELRGGDARVLIHRRDAEQVPEIALQAFRLSPPAEPRRDALGGRGRGVPPTGAQVLSQAQHFQFLFERKTSRAQHTQKQMPGRRQVRGSRGADSRPSRSRNGTASRG